MKVESIAIDLSSELTLTLGLVNVADADKLFVAGQNPLEDEVKSAAGIGSKHVAFNLPVVKDETKKGTLVRMAQLLQYLQSRFDLDLSAAQESFYYKGLENDKPSLVVPGNDAAGEGEDSEMESSDDEASVADVASVASAGYTRPTPNPDALPDADVAAEGSDTDGDEFSSDSDEDKPLAEGVLVLGDAGRTIPKVNPGPRPKAGAGGDAGAGVLAAALATGGAVAVGDEKKEGPTGALVQRKTHTSETMFDDDELFKLFFGYETHHQSLLGYRYSVRHDGLLDALFLNSRCRRCHCPRGDLDGYHQVPVVGLGDVTLAVASAAETVVDTVGEAAVQSTSWCCGLFGSHPAPPMQEQVSTLAGQAAGAVSAVASGAYNTAAPAVSAVATSAYNTAGALFNGAKSALNDLLEGEVAAPAPAAPAPAVVSTAAAAAVSTAGTAGQLASTMSAPTAEEVEYAVNSCCSIFCK